MRRYRESEGQCRCGEIRYEAYVEPGTIVICNCADCQMQSGSAFRMNIPAAASGFRIIMGYSFDPCKVWRLLREKPLVARLRNLNGFCGWRWLQLLDLKASFHENRHKMHGKYAYPI